MSKSLPPRPDLEQLRKQAKTLHHRFHEADADALQRAQACFPRLTATDSGSKSAFQLTDAQLVIAREYGFASWPQLKAEVELRRKDFTERVEHFLNLLTENQTARAQALLAQEPEIARADFYLACACGELDLVQEYLADDPQLANRPGGVKNLPPLLYACFSPLLRADAQRAEAIVEIARRLLALGADPNATYVCGPVHERWHLSALYAASGRANHTGLTELLLKAGANPNDNESLYHSAEFPDLTCTKLLLDYGARIEGSNAVHRKLDYDDLPGLKLFLDRGASPNLVDHAGNSILHKAIANGRKREFLELLHARGADLRKLNSHGMTPYQHALHVGHEAAVKFLEEQGAADKLDIEGQFLAACTMGDEATARRLHAENPQSLARIVKIGGRLLVDAAWRGHLKAVQTMLRLGFSVTATDHKAVTALHNACWMGHLEVAQELIKAGAPLNVVENNYQARPLGWATHGYFNSRDTNGKTLAPNADHAGIIKALVAAGAEVLPGMADNLPEELQALLKKAMKS